MRRRYAFEAEGVSEEVKAQLEKVEDAVEDKCTTEEACDKMLDKVSEEKEKFDDALQTMADAAKDCKDGKCDKAEMAEKITPKMAELKEVAKSIGVASEGEALTEAELKDARDYLNGVEEIVEAKKDEVCDGSCGDDDEDEDEGAEESCLAGAAMEMFGRNRKRTVDMEDMDVVKAYVEANASTMKSGEDVDAQMNDAKSAYDTQMEGESGADLTLSKHTIAGIPVLITTKPDGKVVDIQFSTGGKKFKSISIQQMRSKVGKGLRRADKAAAKAATEAPADESDIWTPEDQQYINAMEAFFVGSIPDLKKSGSYKKFANLRKDFAAAKKMAKSGDTAGAAQKLSEVKSEAAALKEVVLQLPEDSTGMKVLSFIARDIVGGAIASIIGGVTLGITKNPMAAAKVTQYAGSASFGANVSTTIDTPKRMAKNLDKFMKKCDTAIAKLRKGDEGAIDDMSAATESATDIFDGFIDACESYRFNESSMPYLFD